MKRKFIDAEFEIVRPARANPPVTLGEFLSWSWPARLIWLAIVGASLIAAILLARWMFPTLLRALGG